MDPEDSIYNYHPPHPDMDSMLTDDAASSSPLAMSLAHSTTSAFTTSSNWDITRIMPNMLDALCIPYMSDGNGKYFSRVSMEVAMGNCNRVASLMASLRDSAGSPFRNAAPSIFYFTICFINGYIVPSSNIGYE